MGAIFNLAHYPVLETTDRKTVANLGQSIIGQASQECGMGGYTGTWAECDGVRVRMDLLFDSVHEAETWLEENTEKWGPMIAVRVNQQGWVFGAWCSS